MPTFHGGPYPYSSAVSLPGSSSWERMFLVQKSRAAQFKRNQVVWVLVILGLGSQPCSEKLWPRAGGRVTWYIKHICLGSRGIMAQPPAIPWGLLGYTDSSASLTPLLVSVLADCFLFTWHPLLVKGPFLLSSNFALDDNLSNPYEPILWIHLNNSKCNIPQLQNLHNFQFFPARDLTPTPSVCFIRPWPWFKAQSTILLRSWHSGMILAFESFLGFISLFSFPPLVPL